MSAAFLLWPLAALELGPRALAHLIRTLTKENLERPAVHRR